MRVFSYVFVKVSLSIPNPQIIHSCDILNTHDKIMMSTGCQFLYYIRQG